MALKRMVLRDFVIVEALELDFSDGFTVLTGETGAGKSILIDALQLVLGARGDTGVIREGAVRTEICAEFDACPPKALAWLQEAGIDEEDGLLLRRTIEAGSKSRAWINGSPATLGQMRMLGNYLLDIHGQHAWQSLMHPDTVRGLLDAYAGVETQPLAALWGNWRTARTALEDACAARDTLAEERERLQWQIDELEQLAPQPGEWEELGDQHSRLANAQSLLDNGQTALGLLRDNEDSNALDQLGQAQRLLEEYAHLDEELSDMVQTLASCVAQADDVAHSLQRWLHHTDPDPEQLQVLDERLSRWLSLARRWRREPQHLPDLLDEWKERLHTLEQAADLDALEAAEIQHSTAWHDAAKVLSRQRAKAAPALAAAITTAMQTLGMEGGQFEVQLTKSDKPGPNGWEQVAFLVSSHPGMTAKPIGKVASGGELSRIALAISVTTSQLGDAPTLIFDEVDSGIGGAVAETVGKCMQQLGCSRQVLAVTHLPQVAACGHHHLVVAKHKGKGKNATTTSRVTPVENEARVQEIARMLGGERLSDTTLAHAREMLG